MVSRTLNGRTPIGLSVFVKERRLGEQRGLSWHGRSLALLLHNVQRLWGNPTLLDHQLENCLEFPLSPGTLVDALS